jgi:signal transduction histidine kinase
MRWLPAADARDPWRFLPPLVMGFALLILAAGFVIALGNANARLRQLKSEAQSQGEILASTASAALSFSDRKAAQEYVDAMRANPAILQAGLYDAAGRLFAAFHRSQHGLPARLLPGASESDGSLLNITVPITENAQNIGTVYLKLIADTPAQRFARFAGIALLAVMVALVVVVMGAAQSALRRVNADLRQRSDQLAHANKTLVQQIAEREAAEEALRQAQKMEAIGHLTGGIAHDFNNLLQIILSSLMLLRRRAQAWSLEPDAMAHFDRYVDAACAGGERAAALTRQLLAFARRQPLRPTGIDVKTMMASMTELLGRALGEAIELRTDLKEPLWDVFADANQLENALVNLAVNARDAMGGSGRLIISARNAQLENFDAGIFGRLDSGDYVRISVADTGCGMTPDVLSKAFEPFFTTKDVGQGTGLGLSQVYGFVRQSGGLVTIDSKVGVGTTMSLYLPRRLGVSGDAEAAMGTAEAGAGDLILVVEDDPAVRVYTLEMLAELGYSTIEAADGHAALRLLDSRPDARLLLTDVGLPGGMNGRQLADEAVRRCAHLRVLFTSGYTRDALVRGGRLDEQVTLLSKPYTYAELAAKIAELFWGRGSSG